MRVTRNDLMMIDWRSDQFSLGVTFSVLALYTHPNAEPTDSSKHEAVDRVMQRQPPSKAFVDACAVADLAPLSRMVAPWPVQRFRTPADLLAAW